MTAGGHGFDGVERRGLMFVLSSPSGAGKTTLSRLLIERMAGLKMSVSATTRPMRPGEVDGRDYQFVDKPRFEQMAKRDELLEWATVFDNRYGTPRVPVEAALAAGQDVLFDIDWQGTRQLAAQQAENKRLSDQVGDLSGAIDNLKQSYASEQSPEASSQRSARNSSIRSRHHARHHRPARSRR